MSSKKVSVIIPVYNSAKHITVTFDSLACQTMPASDFEIICVNDCSTDNSREVIEQYATKMPNLILINLPENTGGPMAPRNTGIEAATGTYIQFLDNDDFLGEEALERLYAAAETYHADVIFGRYVGVNGRDVPKVMFANGNISRASLLKDKIVYSLAPHKMFRKSLLQEHGIRFHTASKSSNEDQWFVMQCYIKARVITVLADYDYYFVVARGKENLSEKTFAAESFFFVPHLIMKYAGEQITDPALSKNIKLAFLNRFFGTEVLRKRLFHPLLSTDVKQSWLFEGKKFLDAHVSAEMMERMAPASRELARIVKNGDLQDVHRFSQQMAKTNQSIQKRTKAYLDKVQQTLLKNVIHSRARQNSLKAYSRPSVNSLPVLSGTSTANPVKVNFLDDGWLEVRLPDSNGGSYAVFVNQNDIRGSVRFRSLLLFERVLTRLKNAVMGKNT